MKNIMLNKRKANQLVHCVVVFLFSISANIAATANSSPSVFDAMSHTEVLELTIKTNLQAIENSRRNDTQIPATIRFNDKSGKEQDWTIKLGVRGKFRRIRCAAIPPLKLNFSKKDLAAAGLAKFDDYKLVNHCTTDKAEAKELVLKEYLAYKLYNTITENSFRVQLLNITFVDTETGKKIKQSGFLIEDTAELRARIGAAKVKKNINIPASQFQACNVRQVALFQYLIGNVDWDLSTSRNLKFVHKDSKVLAIPYDFDFSGFVNAPYALASSKYGLNYITDRVYLGFEEAKPNLTPLLATFKEKQSEFIQTIRTFKILKGKSRRVLQNYLNTYFDNYQFLNWPTLQIAVDKIGD